MQYVRVYTEKPERQLSSTAGIALNACVSLDSSSTMLCKSMYVPVLVMMCTALCAKLSILQLARKWLAVVRYSYICQFGELCIIRPMMPGSCCCLESLGMFRLEQSRNVPVLQCDQAFTFGFQQGSCSTGDIPVTVPVEHDSRCRDLEGQGVESALAVRYMYSERLCLLRSADLWGLLCLQAARGLDMLSPALACAGMVCMWSGLHCRSGDDVAAEAQLPRWHNAGFLSEALSFCTGCSKLCQSSDDDSVSHWLPANLTWAALLPAAGH
jgi:hypothetical protein